MGEDKSLRNKAEQGKAHNRVLAEHWRDVTGGRTEKVIPEIKISRYFLLLSYALGDKICPFDDSNYRTKLYNSKFRVESFQS